MRFVKMDRDCAVTIIGHLIKVKSNVSTSMTVINRNSLTLI